ncbi:hypothetical protein FHS10_002809 [Mucilaginibacter dorajii]|nr:hypothetical protein [Mucilaginibacter dorajii]
MLNFNKVNTKMCIPQFRRIQIFVPVVGQYKSIQCLDHLTRTKE